MNKGIIFVAGLLTGGALGSVATYFITKKSADAKAEEEIEAYAEYADAKIEHLKRLIDGNDEAPEEEMKEEDEEVANNEGVKKYHHQDESIASLAGRQPFGKKESKEKEMLGEKNEKFEEISEEEFLKTYVGPTDGPYDKVTLDLLWTGIEDNPHDWENQLYWGYGTDNEILAMMKPEYKGLEMTDILGDMWRWCSDYLLDEPDGELNAVGAFYVRNHKLHQDIECIVHNMKEDSVDD